MFVDVDADTHTIDPARVEEAITPQTSAILGVHLWGRACEVEALEAIADDRGLALLFDAAHALGCSHRGRWIGGFGDAEVMSFHATKVANAAEGGAILTDDDELAARMRVIRNFGFVDLDQVGSLGTNAKMNELCAAMGLTSLESFDEFVEANRRNHGATRPSSPISTASTWLPRSGRGQQLPLRRAELSPAFVERLRDDLVAALHAENVLARRYFTPAVTAWPAVRDDRPGVTRDRGSPTRVVALPTGTAMSEDDIVQVCALVRDTLA